MIPNTVSTKVAQRFYDQLGARYDWVDFYEGKARQRAIELLELKPGQVALNVGVGTGKEQVSLAKLIAPGGCFVGLDVSSMMVWLTRQRSWTPVLQADMHHLPLLTASFDRLYAAYVLDLIPLDGLPRILNEFHRVLRPGGRLVLVTLTEGEDWFSRAIISVWKAVYRISPVACGGCRPLKLSTFVQAANFDQVKREVVVQFGVPSELLVAT